MNRSDLIRRGHRWVSVAFTETVVAHFIVRIWRPAPVWLTDSPLIALFLLLSSGPYLFVLPFVVPRRRA